MSRPRGVAQLRFSREASLSYEEASGREVATCRVRSVVEALTDQRRGQFGNAWGMPRRSRHTGAPPDRFPNT